MIGLLTWLGMQLHEQTKPTAAPNTARPVTIEPAAALPTVTAVQAPAAAPRRRSPSHPAAGDGNCASGAPTGTHGGQASSAVAPPGGATVFSICPDGHEGVVGGHTSCAFAENVRRTFYASGMADTFTAFSPVTGDAYEMTCAGRYPAYFEDGSTMISTRCYGGNNAEVVIW